MRRININEYLYIDYDLEADNSVNNKDAEQYSIPKNIKLHNIPNSVIYYDDKAGIIYLKNGMKWVDILEFDEKTGEFKWLITPLDFITTLEITNESLNNGTNADYTKNSEIFDEQRKSKRGILPSIDTERELHTHFIQVLSAEQLLDFLKDQGVKSIFCSKGPAKAIAIIPEEDYIKLTAAQIEKKYNCKAISIDEAKKEPKILEQLSGPIDANTDFEYFESCFPMRSALVSLSCYSAKDNSQQEILDEINKINKEIEALEKSIENVEIDYNKEYVRLMKRKEICEQTNNETGLKKALDKISELMKINPDSIKSDLKNELKKKKELVQEKKEALIIEAYKDLFARSLEVLKDQGVNYVEFSYSNVERIKKIIEDFSGIEGIDFKFLISQHRKESEGSNFISSCKGLSEILSDDKYKDKIAGFDLMGMEDKIRDPEDFVDSGKKCNTLRTKIEYAVTGMLAGSIDSEKKPVLRLHAGEIYYEEGNPNLTLEILMQIEDEIRNEYAEIYSILNDYKNNNTDSIDTLERSHKKYEFLMNQRNIEELKNWAKKQKQLHNAKKPWSAKVQGIADKAKKTEDKFEDILGAETMSIIKENILSKLENGNISEFEIVDEVIAEELKALEKDSKKYRIVIEMKKQNLSEEELEAEIKRLEDLKDNFCLKDRFEIRIGHGLHFKETKEYYEMLRHFGVIVELCPSSNTKLGNMQTLDEIPYDKYVEEGIPVVVGTDGGGYFRSSMKQEASLVSAVSKTKRKNAITPNTPPTDDGELDTLLGCFLDDWDNSSKTSNVAKGQSDNGLNMDMTVDEYMSSINNSNTHFMEGYENAAGKKKYVNNYFKDLYVVHGDKNNKEIERLRTEIGKTFNFIMDMQSNELYFNNSELQLIKNNFDRIEEYFKEEKYVKAAILLVSLQGVMGYQTDLVEVLYLIKENDLNFSQCLKTKVINKYKFDEVDRINDDNIKNNKLRSPSYINTYGDPHMHYADFHRYYAEETYLRELTSEYKKLLAAIEENPTMVDSNVNGVVRNIYDCLHRLYNSENDQKYYFDTKDIEMAAAGIEVLGKRLGIEVSLNGKYDIFNSKDYSLDDYLADIDSNMHKETDMVYKKDSVLEDIDDLYLKEEKEGVKMK